MLLQYEDYMGIIITGLVIFSLVLLIVELIWIKWNRRFTLDRFKEMLASYSPLLPVILVDTAISAIWVAIFYQVADFIPWQIPINGFTILLALLLVDLSYYWEHRSEHQIRLLWALYHSVHHSSPDYNQSTAYRISFIDIIITPIFFLPIVLLGFHPILVLTSLVFIISYQTWIHTEMIGRIGFLDKLFNTPSNHRVHHGSTPNYIDKNYGAVLIIWDKLFGTYQAEQETPIYGLTKQLNSVNPLKVHFHELMKLWHDFTTAKSLKETIGYLFRHPGWRP